MSMPCRCSSCTRALSTTAFVRRSMRMEAICAWSVRPRWACWFARRAASGSATSAVTRTETSATRQVLSTARAVIVLRIGGVADAADGPDHRGVPAELRADLGDVHVDGTGTGVRRVPPHRGEQLLPRVHPTRPVQQVGQQVELGRGEVDRGAAGLDRAPLRVEHDPAGPPYPLLPVGWTGGAAQHRLDPRDQLARAERLGQVVVATLFQPEDPVHLVVAGGQEQYRGPVTRRAHPLADLGAGDARQPDVQYAGDGAQLPGGGQAGGAVVLDVYPETVPRQVQLHQVGDRAFVLDDEDQPLARRVGHPPMMAQFRSAPGQPRVRNVYGSQLRPRIVRRATVPRR